MNVSRKQYWLKVTQAGKPYGLPIHVEFPPRIPAGVGRWINISPCLQVCDTVLDTPTSFTAGSITNTTLSLNWADVTSATNYTVDRATNGSFTGAVEVYSGTTSAANITGLSAGSTYYFRVQATDGACFLPSEYAFLVVSTTNTTTTTTP